MHKKIYILFTFIMMAFLVPSVVFGSSTVEDVESGNGYKIIIEDEADLLTQDEEVKLMESMTILSEYGNVIFKTNNTSISGTPLSYIQNYYYSKFNNNPGVAFYIDMNKRELCACATGGLDKIITTGKCNSIMDNVYRYASNGNYYRCALETFNEMNQLLTGGKIQESMKYICNAIVSIMISLFASYGLFILLSGSKKASKRDIIKECGVILDHGPISVQRTDSHKEYSP